MYKIAIGPIDSRTLLLVLTPDDIRQYRARPCDDYSRIDCARFERPDVRILMTYTNNPKQARQFIANLKFQWPLNQDPEADICFSGNWQGSKLIGVVISERTMRHLEAEPMQAHSILQGKDFGIEGFTVMILYADTDGVVVRFLTKMGVPHEKMVADPALRPLLENYAREMRDIASQMTGQTIPDEPVEIVVGRQAGMSEKILLAVRGQELAWFAQNPMERVYFRRAVPGEFPTDVNAAWVKVIRGDDIGMRARIPMQRDMVTGEFIEITGDKGKS